MQVWSLDFCFSIKEETLQFAEKQACGAFRGGGHIRTSVLDYHFLKLSSVEWSPWPETQVNLGTGGHFLVGDGGVLHPDLLPLFCGSKTKKQKYIGYLFWHAS